MRLLRKKRTARFYHDTTIPARVFFDIIESDDRKKLVHGDGLPPKKSELERAWSFIYDEYYRLMDDPKMKLIMKVKKKILTLHSKIEVANMVIVAVATKPMGKQHRDILLKKLGDIGIRINTDNDHREEILRTLKVTIAGLVNLRELELDNLKNLTKGVKSNFDDSCAVIEEYGFKVDEDVSLGRYISYVKRISKKSKNVKGRGINREHK